MGQSVEALAQLARYVISISLDPLLAPWRARRDVEADKTRALGAADNMRTLILEAARSIVEARRELDQVTTPTSEVQISSEEIDQRIQHHIDTRLSNLMEIVEKAQLALPHGAVPDVEPDISWTSAFSDGAPNVSHEELQRMWAKVLAKEVVAPGSISLKTLRILKDVEYSTAMHFRRLCSLALMMEAPDDSIYSHRVFAVSEENWVNKLADYGLKLPTLSLLAEHGLLTWTYARGSVLDLTIFIDYEGLPAVAFRRGGRICYQGSEWQITHPTAPPRRPSNEKFEFYGMDLTQSGTELSRVVELESLGVPEVAAYDEHFRTFLKKRRLTLTAVDAEQ